MKYRCCICSKSYRCIIDDGLEWEKKFETLKRIINEGQFREILENLNCPFDSNHESVFEVILKNYNDKQLEDIKKIIKNKDMKITTDGKYPILILEDK